MNRDSQTFLNVIESNKGIIYKVANSYCKDDDNRKDLIQEIIIQLWLSFTKYDEKFKLSTWMYRIALNVSISFYRKEHTRSRINEPFPDDILYFNDEPSDRSETETDVVLLNKFIKELKEIDRAIIILHLEGNSQQETADILGFTATNVSTRISRIKQQLKQKFFNLKTQI
ncbi:MAG: RNA polymerase sigma factor [bacterium]